MSLLSGWKSKIFVAVLLLNGAFLFTNNIETAQAYHATSSYNKVFSDTLTSANWNDLFSDFANTWLPVSLNGPVGIATAAPASGLEVNGLIMGSSMYSTGNVGFGTAVPNNARLEVVPATGYSILAGNFKIGNVALPTAANDAATKGYVDSFVATATSSLGGFWDGTLGGNIWNLNSGNVGIGTVAPTDYLYIKGLTGGYGGLTIDQPSGAYTTFKASGVTKWNFGNYPTDNSFRLSTGAFITAQLTVLPSGNVGIGTTTPKALLSLAPASGYAMLAGNYKIGDVALPTLSSDAATKGYVDAYVAVATGAISGVAKYIGITPTAYTGDNNGTAGYATAETACLTTYASSSVCTPDNFLASIAAGIALPSEDVWIFAGPPGYTAAANDCEGRSVGTTAAYGTYWQIALPGRPQGRGLLMRCNNALRLACCR